VRGIYEKPGVGGKALEINKDLGRGYGSEEEEGEGDEGGWGERSRNR